IAQNPLYKPYYKKMFDERNKKWADKIADYLKQGGKTFIFAGTGHFTGDNSVFSYMRKNGTLQK
ncbi:MAG: TraB/GumN family protein, partial [Spirochaetaceae bacterium]|nr:TraB/GumN family protein [Spirochaetaceae bacterium]